MQTVLQKSMAPILATWQSQTQSLNVKEALPITHTNGGGITKQRYPEFLFVESTQKWHLETNKSSWTMFVNRMTDFKWVFLTKCLTVGLHL